MTDITYDKVAAAPAPASVREPGKTSWWQRAFAAMVAARLHQAERIVAEYKELTKRS